MKSKILFSLLLAAAPLSGFADQLVPAGSVISCTVAESKISSETEKIGDPVMCQLSHVEVYGRTQFPYGSYLIGHFQDYKDPGHFVGKGWMELKFDRLVVQPDTIVPISARVVAAPKYPVDKEGRIHGTGHPTRDTIEWLIPVLWPIDLINLPRRGPRPYLKPESKLTLKVMDDFGIPTPQENAVRNPALISRVTEDEPSYQQYRPQPQNYPPPQQQYAPPPQQSYAPPQQPYYPPQQQSPTVVVVQAPQPVVQQQPVIVQSQPQIIYSAPPPPPPPMYVPYGYGPARYVVPGYRYYGPY